MKIDLHMIDDDELNEVLGIEEAHFVDVKSIEIRPASLTKTISAYANSEN